MEVLDESFLGFWSRILGRAFRVSSARVSEEDHWRLLSETLKDRRVGLYTHFPFCRYSCLCCPFYKEVWTEEKFEKYSAALVQEIRLLGRRLKYKGSEATDAHVSGGTPSLADPAFWKRVTEELRAELNLKAGVGIEANPEDLADESKAFGFAEAGISEVSAGGQSFHRAHLRALGRRHGPREIEASINNCRRAGFKLVNLDLMTLFPNAKGEEQTRNWGEDLRRAVQLGPDQITVYPTLITRLCVGYKLVGAGRVGQPVNLFGTLLRMAKEFLEGEGYRRVRIYSWSRGGEYATVDLEMVGPLLCLGPGAFGFTGAYEWANVHSVAEYVRSVSGGKPAAAVSRTVSLEERAARLMVDQLFCAGRASEESFGALLGRGFDAIPRGMKRGLMLMGFWAGSGVGEVKWS